MKITVLHVAITAVSVVLSYALDTHGQGVLDRKVSLRVENTKVKDVLAEIEANAGVSFTYRPRLIKHIGNVTLNVSDRRLYEILTDVLGESIQLEVVGKQIILKETEAPVLVDNSFKGTVLFQGRQVTGTVKDENGAPVPGVNVIEKGTTNGTATDSDGRYSLILTAEDAVLVFSFIGYTTQEIAVGGRTSIEVAMAPDTQTLQEVVVVGYGEQRKATMTGSVTSVKGTEIAQSPAVNVSNSLVGRMPGVVAITPSGEPGYDGATIRIRGVNTMGNNDPLIVVDGVPGRSLQRLDPSVIESITILKDASAAIYGSQAANGVIFVTTKRGKVGKPEIQVNFDQGYGQPTRIPEMADAAEYSIMLNEINYYKGLDPKYTAEEIQKYRDGSDPWLYPNTDWFKEVLKPWSAQNYLNAQLSGGSENMMYFISLGMRSQDGFYKNSATKYSQYDFRSNIDGKVSNNVKIGFDLAGRLEDRNFPTRSAGSIFRMVMRGKPNEPGYWPNGLPGPDIEYGDNPVVVSTDATGYDRDKWYILQSNLQVNINIPWVKGLSITSNSSIDKGFRFRKRFETPWYLYSWDRQSYDANGNPVLVKGQKGFSDARLREEMEDNMSVVLNGRVDYEKKFSLHGIKLMAGIEKRSNEGDRFSAYRRFFISTTLDQMFAGGDAEKDNGGSAFLGGRMSYFGRMNYNYSEKYLLELVWRYDGSYIFPENSRYGFFPGISAGWRVSEEDFWKASVPFIENFKLRGSWGQTGNDRVPEWNYLSSYAFRSQPYIFGVTEQNKALYNTLIENPNITWEVANQSNIGFEASMMNGRLSVEADYFNYTRSKLLWYRNASVPYSAGLTLPRENIAKTANNGFEMMISYSDKVGEFAYDVSINGGYQKNKVVFIDETPGAPEYQRNEGYPLPTDANNLGLDLYYQAIGIFDDQADVDSQPHWTGARPGDVIFKDVNNDGQIDGNDRMRNPFTNIPRFTGGINIGLQFKQFDLSILVQGAAGAVRYIDTESGEIGNFLKDFYDNRWTEENPTADYPRTFNRSNEYWRNQRNTFWLHRTDYVRLKNFQLGYSLPDALLQRVGVQNLRVYVSGLNLLTYTPHLKDFDPELGPASGQGYPLQRIVNAGLSLTF